MSESKYIIYKAYFIIGTHQQVIFRVPESIADDDSIRNKIWEYLSENAKNLIINDEEDYVIDMKINLVSPDEIIEAMSYDNYHIEYDDEGYARILDR